MELERAIGVLSGMGATWVLWLLIGLSLASLAVVIERGVFFSSSRDDLERLRAEVLSRLRQGDLAGVKRRLQESPALEASIVLAGLTGDRLSGLDRESVSERLQAEAERSRIGMERHLALLGTVGSNAPFVGLLGTVIGIIRAFQELEESAGKLSGGLMAEIGEALVATAAGLMVALPAVMFFNLFQRLIRARLGRAEALGRDVLAELSPSARAASELAS